MRSLRPNDFLARTTMPTSVEPARIMAVADGYAMARFPGCTPFVVPVRDVEFGIWRVVKKNSKRGKPNA